MNRVIHSAGAFKVPIFWLIPFRRGRVVDGKTIPDPIPRRRAIVVSQRFPAMDVEVVDDEMNRDGVSILPDQVAGDGSEFGGRAIRRGKSEVLSGLRLHGAEDIGSTAALVFTVLPRLAARDSR